MGTNIFLDPKRNIKTVKNYIEILTSPFEKEINLNDLKNFTTLVNNTNTNFLYDLNYIETKDIKESVKKIISMNTDMQKNNEFTHYLYNEIQLENNHYIFKSLLANIFTLLKKQDEDQFLIDYLPFISMNLKTINPKILIKSEYILAKLSTMTKELDFKESFKGVGIIHLINLINIFPSIGVDIRDTKFYKYTIDTFLQDSMYNLDKINNFEFFDIFKFYITYKYLDKNFNFNNFQKINKLFSKNLITRITTETTIPADKITNNNFRYDSIALFMAYFKNDKNILNYCEYLLHQKLELSLIDPSNNKSSAIAAPYCPLNKLIEIISVYINNNLSVSGTLLHFIAFTCLEHLKLSVTLKAIEKEVIIIYDILCEYYHILPPSSETLKEFMDEFKANIYHCTYRNDKHDEQDEVFDHKGETSKTSKESKEKEVISFPTYNTNTNSSDNISLNISIDTLKSITVSHDKLLHTNLYDKSFNNFLKNAIKLYTQITILSI
jgi:hypothetical protein